MNIAVNYDYDDYYDYGGDYIEQLTIVHGSLQSKVSCTVFSSMRRM